MYDAYTTADKNKGSMAESIDIKDKSPRKTGLYCSKCGAEIENMSIKAKESLKELKKQDPSFANEMATVLENGENYYDGTICLSCRHTFCKKCVPYGPGKCPDCGNQLYALSDSSLQGYTLPKTFRDMM